MEVELRRRQGVYPEPPQVLAPCSGGNHPVSWVNTLSSSITSMENTCLKTGRDTPHSCLCWVQGKVWSIYSEGKISVVLTWKHMIFSFISLPTSWELCLCLIWFPYLCQTVMTPENLVTCIRLLNWWVLRTFSSP